LTWNDKKGVAAMTENVSKLKDKDVQDLTNSLYLIKGLYVQMANERDHLTNTASKMVNTTKQFQGYLEKLADQKEQITVTIERALRKESGNIAKMLVDKTYEEITTQTNKTLRTLEASIKEAKERINDYGRKERLFSRWFLAVMFIAALIGGLMGGIFVIYCSDVGGATQIQNNLKREKIAKAWSEFKAD